MRLVQLVSTCHYWTSVSFVFCSSPAFVFYLLMLRLIYLKVKLTRQFFCFFFLAHRSSRVEVDKLHQAVADVYGRRRRAELIDQSKLVSKVQVTGHFLYMIGSAMIEHVEKHDKHHVRAFVTLYDWSHSPLASAAPRPKIKRSIVTFREWIPSNWKLTAYRFMAQQRDPVFLRHMLPFRRSF